MNPPQTIAHYRIVSKLGEGGMGAVYRATDTKLNRDVAIKVLPDSFANDPDRLARFTREAQVLASLNHPNIAAIYGVEDRALVLELVEGPTLAERIAQGPIPIGDALPIARQIAEALEYAHEKGIIHRDLKPANVKVTPDGRVKVLDFGLAKALVAQAPAGESDAASSPTLTMRATAVGMILGTAGYMSPEQAKGKPVDRRADIWSFGVLLAEMLTGRAMYSGETVGEVLAAVIMKEPAIPESAPPDIRQLLRRCLDRDVSRRLQAIGEARIALENPAAPAPAPPPPSKPRRAILPWAVAAAALLATGVSLTRSHSAPPPPVVRFQLPLLDRAAAEYPIFELSPDGRYLALAASIDGPAQIWVRAIDSTDVRAVAGTEGASYPFWSPDSSSLAFFTQGKLKKIAVSGGAAQVLCDAPDGRGGTWSADGVIVFAPKDSGPLFRVASSGGAPVAVTAAASSGQREVERYPSFITGAGRFLYLQATNSPETSGVYLGSLDGAPPVRVLADMTSAYYTADASGKGWIVFRRESSVMAQPFDPSSARLSGEAVQLAASVGQAGNTNRGAFSASANGSLAVWPNFGGARRQLVWVDRGGRRLDAVTKPSPVLDFEISPDEKRLVMRIGGARSDFWLQDLERGALSRFTFTEHADGRALWSPDGRTIVYTERPSSVLSRLYRKPADSSSKEEMLIESDHQISLRDWSPDGKYLVFRRQNNATAQDLFLFPMGDTGGAARTPIAYQTSSANEYRGSFSPDSRWIAYTSDESSEPRVYVQAVPASGPKWQISTAGGDYASWRRDGRELYYLSSGHKLMAVPVEAGPGGFRPGTPQELFEVPGQSDYQPSADGRRFLVRLAPEGEPSVPPLEIILNWPSSLRKREPAP